MARPKFAPKSNPFRGPIAKPHYLPHPWTRPTYDAKRHSDPIRRFSTMHWTVRRTYGRTDRPTDRPRESLIAIGRSTVTATRPNNNCIKNYSVMVKPIKQQRSFAMSQSDVFFRSEPTRAQTWSELSLQVDYYKHYSHSVVV